METNSRAKAKDSPLLAESKIRCLAKSIRSAGKEIARDSINKDYLLEGRYKDTIYVTSDSGYESIVIGDTSYNTSKGYMLLYTNNTPKVDSFPSVAAITKLLWKVIRKEKLEEGEGKAAYHPWDCYQSIERQLEYFAEVVVRVAEVLYI